MKKLALVAIAVLVSSCFAAGGGDGADGGSGDGGGITGDGGGSSGSCTGSQTRCNKSTYQVCQNGSFVDQATCSAPQVCVGSLGCADCNPASSGVCQNGDVHTCNADGTIGGVSQSCGVAQCQSGQCVDNGCAAGSGLVYVVDDANELLSFDPNNGANTFTTIGTLSCKAASSLSGWGSGPGQPFSMSVDRSGHAWVLYTSGEIFEVSTSNTASCTKTSWTVGSSGFELFGMGFVANSPGSSAETLFIAGGSAGTTGTGNIGAIDPNTMQVTTVGPFASGQYGPELTGTGNAELYGYFPGTSSTYVAQIDTSTGQNGQSWTLPNLSGQVDAWAFAHWGGRFYIFVTTGGSGSQNSQVLLLDPTHNGQVTTLKSNLPYIIVGAGVSTCAPVAIP